MGKTRKWDYLKAACVPLGILAIVLTIILQIIVLENANYIEDMFSVDVIIRTLWLPQRLALNIVVFFAAIIFWKSGEKWSYAFFSLLYILAVVLAGISYFPIADGMRMRLSLLTILLVVPGITISSMVRFEKRDPSDDRIVGIQLILLSLIQIYEFI